MKSLFLVPILALCATSPIVQAEVASSTASSSTAMAATAADPYLHAYAAYYTASTLNMLAEAVDMGVANDASVLSETNVIILENIPAEIFNNLQPEFKSYLQSVLPLEQAAASQIAELAEGDTDGLSKISNTLQAQKEALVASYPNAAPLLNNMDTLTGVIFTELNLDQYQSDYTEKNAEALQNDPKAMSTMLRGMLDIVLKSL